MILIQTNVKMFYERTQRGKYCPYADTERKILHVTINKLTVVATPSKMIATLSSYCYYPLPFVCSQSHFKSCTQVLYEVLHSEEMCFICVQLAAMMFVCDHQQENSCTWLWLLLRCC